MQNRSQWLLEFEYLCWNSNEKVIQRYLIDNIWARHGSAFISNSGKMIVQGLLFSLLATRINCQMHVSVDVCVCWFKLAGHWGKGEVLTENVGELQWGVCRHIHTYLVSADPLFSTHTHKHGHTATLFGVLAAERGKIVYQRCAVEKRGMLYHWETFF